MRGRLRWGPCVTAPLLWQPANIFANGMTMICIIRKKCRISYPPVSFIMPMRAFCCVKSFIAKSRLLWQFPAAVCGRERCWRARVALSRYPRMRRGEDYWVVHRLAKRKRVVVLDFPELYVYTYHGDNTWGRNHFARVFAKSEHVYFLRPELRNALAELGESYPDLSGDAQMCKD